MEKYKRLIRLLLPHKKALIVGSVFLIGASLANLAIPLLIKNLVDVVMVKKNLNMLNSIALNIGFLFLLQLLFSTAHNYLFDLTEKRITTDFRKRIFEHLQTLSLGFFAKRRTGEIMSRMTNDVTTLESLITDIPQRRSINRFD